MPTFVVVRTPTSAVSLGDGSSAHSTAELAVVLLLLLLLLVSWGRRRWREWWRRLGSGQSPHRRAVARGKPRPAQLAVPCVRLPPPLPLQPPVSHDRRLPCPVLVLCPPACPVSRRGGERACRAREASKLRLAPPRSRYGYIPMQMPAIHQMAAGRYHLRTCVDDGCY
jgi:hypothetical protein